MKVSGLVLDSEVYCFLILDSVSDNEENAWEEQQIKKGTSIPAQPVSLI